MGVCSSCNGSCSGCKCSASASRGGACASTGRLTRECGCGLGAETVSRLKGLKGCEPDLRAVPTGPAPRLALARRRHFSLYFTHWDRWCGTLLPSYDEQLFTYRLFGGGGPKQQAAASGKAAAEQASGRAGLHEAGKGARPAVAAVSAAAVGGEVHAKAA